MTSSPSDVAAARSDRPRFSAPDADSWMPSNFCEDSRFLRVRSLIEFHRQAYPVTPAKAGVQLALPMGTKVSGIPAFAGMTVRVASSQ